MPHACRCCYVSTKSAFTSISAILGRPGRSVRAGPRCPDRFPLVFGLFFIVFAWFLIVFGRFFIVTENHPTCNSRVCTIMHKCNKKNIQNRNPVLNGPLRFLWAGPTHGADMGPFQNKGDREGTCSRYCFAKTCRTFYDFWPYGPTSVCKMLSFEQNWGPGVHFSRRSKSGACSLRFKCSSVFD